MDEFYIPEDIAEWIGLKKSEYLCRLIENISSDDFQFEEYQQFENLIPSTINKPDWSCETTEDKQIIRTYCRAYEETSVYQQIVVGVVISDQEKNDVFIPILSFVSKKENLVSLFAKGKFSRPILN